MAHADERIPRAATPWDGDAQDIGADAWRGELRCKADGQTLEPKDAGNFRVLLTNQPAVRGHIRLNQFSQVIEIGEVPWNKSGQIRPLVDGDVVRAREWLQRLGLRPSKDEVRDAVFAAAEAHSYHPIRDYLGRLEWDRTERLEHWLSDCLGVDDGAYPRMIGPKVLIAAVARIMRPGCQVDTMLVIEGAQGIRKSSAIAALFGRDWTRESVSLFANHQKMVLLMAGAWVVELAEFVAVKRGEQSSVKGLISTRTDSVVLPYARAASNHPRQCVFIGTINPQASGYLSDDTGNRRYWPVTATEINLELIAAARDQLWAEAVHRYRAGERWWLDADEARIATREQSGRSEEDPWDDILREKLVLSQSVRPEEVYAKLGVPAERQSKSIQMRAAECMKRLGFVRDRDRVDGHRVRLWVRRDDLAVAGGPDT